MHTAKACIISCIDFRFHDEINQFLEKHGYKSEIDLISIAGASHDLVCPSTAEDSHYLWKQIGISLDLHNPKDIIIIDHQDCGMYEATGEVVKGMSIVEDLSIHKKLLKNLRKEFKKRFPDHKVKLHLWFAELDGTIVSMFNGKKAQYSPAE